MEELLASDLTVHGAIRHVGYGDSERERQVLTRLNELGVETILVSDADLRSASDTEQPQGIVAIAQIPHFLLADLPEQNSGRWLVLDAIQDPGNVGTILRSAAAFGMDAVITLPGTVDVWNAKVVRSSMGASFRLPVLAATRDELARFLSERSISLWVADAGGDAATDTDVPERLALAVGNEGAGISGELLRLAERRVAIPMEATVESLNVAVATGILLFILRP